MLQPPRRFTSPKTAAKVGNGCLRAASIFAISGRCKFIPRANELYVGTLPAAVYVSENGGRSFRELSAFRRLPEYPKWTFPPPPHTAHIRCITLDARVPDEILVGIEEGGVARSRDRGESWEDISGPARSNAYTW